MHEGAITICIDADVKEIERMNRLVRQFGELHEIPSRTLYAMNLALDEMITNAVTHGYDDPAGEQVRVHIETSRGELIATVTDRGRGFNPLDAPPSDLAASMENRPVGGLGIQLVRTLMDRVKYERANGENVLTLQKRIR